MSLMPGLEVEAEVNPAILDSRQGMLQMHGKMSMYF